MQQTALSGLPLHSLKSDIFEKQRRCGVQQGHALKQLMPAPIADQENPRDEVEKKLRLPAGT